MKYKVVDEYNPCITTTLPRYAVYRKRLFGWKFIGRTNDRTGHEVAYADFDKIKHKDGEWIYITFPSLLQSWEKMS